MADTRIFEGTVKLITAKGSMGHDDAMPEKPDALTAYLAIGEERLFIHARTREMADAVLKSRGAEKLKVEVKATPLYGDTKKKEIAKGYLLHRVL